MYNIVVINNAPKGALFIIPRRGTRTGNYQRELRRSDERNEVEREQKKQEHTRWKEKKEKKRRSRNRKNRNIII